MTVYPHRPPVLNHPDVSANARRIAMPRHPDMDSVNYLSRALSTIFYHGIIEDNHGAKNGGDNKGSVGNKKNSDKEKKRLLREHSEALALAIEENEREHSRKRTSGVGGGIGPSYSSSR